MYFFFGVKWLSMALWRKFGGSSW